jgi:glycosyltransferase involved in cell wall biosynthesis
MKIGISGYVGNKLTGIGRVLENILINLAKTCPNDEFYLFVNYDFIEFIDKQWPTNVIVFKINISKDSSIGNIIWHQLMFQFSLKKYKCDLALIPNFSLLLWKAIPTVVVLHDMIEFNIPDKFSKLRMRYRYFAVPRMAKVADFIITVSESSKRDIIKFCKTPQSKIQVIPNAADSSAFKQNADIETHEVLKKYELNIHEYLLFVGTIDYPGKNIKVLIEAYFNLKDKFNIREKLVIIGKNGHNSEYIYDYVQQSEHKDSVLFTGYVDDIDLPYFYSGAKILVNLSLYEGFGLPVLEAMSCGCPVIVPNTSSFPEIVKGIDVCVNPTDLTEIEDKIRSLLTNEVFYQEVKEKCFQKAQKYSWKASAIQYLTVFNNLLIKNKKNDK